MVRMGKLFRRQYGSTRISNSSSSNTERDAKIRLKQKEKEYDRLGYFTDSEGVRVSHEPHYYFGLRKYDRPSKRK